MNETACCGPYQLEILASDWFPLQEAVDDVDGEEKCVWQQLELLVDLHQPVNENCPHLGIDVSLLQTPSKFFSIKEKLGARPVVRGRLLLECWLGVKAI